MTAFQTEHAVVIAAPIERVWEVITSSTAGRDWRTADFATDWTVGSLFEIAAHIGSKTYRDRGRVLAVVPPGLLRYAYWSRVSGLNVDAENWSVVTLSLAAVADGTRLTVVQAVPPSPARYARGETIGTESGVRHAAFYWRTSLEVIRQVAEAAG